MSMKSTSGVSPWLRAGGLVASAWLSASASAGTFDVGDTGTAGGIEVEVELTSAHSRDEFSRQRPGVTVNGRITDRLEWSVGGGFGVLRDSHGVTREGLGDLSMGTKWRLLDEGPDGGLSFAVEPTLVLPLGDESKGIGAGAVGFELPVRLARHVGPIRITGEVSVARTFGRDGDVLGAGMLTEYIGPGPWSYGIELVVDAPRTDTGAYHLHGNAGIKWEPDEHVELQAMAGRSIANRDGSPVTEFRLFLAYKL